MSTSDAERPAGDPDRAGLHGRDGGPGRRPVRRVDPARGPQLPDLGPADAAPVPARPRAGQAGGGRDEPGPSACSTRPTGRGDRGRRPRGRRAARTTASSRSTSTRRAPGTSTNTNMNEVIAHLASARLGAKVHPNDDVNKCQSSNDTIPTALQLSAAVAIEEELIPALIDAAGRARRQGRRVLGRRQDRPHPPPGRDADPAGPGVRGLRGPGRGGDPARPGRARRAAHGAPRRDGGGDRDQRPSRVRGPGLRPALGADRAARSARRPTTSTPRRRSTRPSRRTAACGRSRSACGRSRRTSGSWAWAPARASASSRCPETQPGSSIMPGKVNPVIVESLTMVVARVVGNDATVGVRPDGVAARAQRDAPGHVARAARVDHAARGLRPELQGPPRRRPGGDRPRSRSSWSRG